MAQTILAILAILSILAGLACACFAALSFLGNAMGGVTNPSMIDQKPTVVAAVLALGFVVLGIWLL